MKLVIVESPAKGKTIESFLGNGYRVESSYGHVRDLPKSKLGVDVEQGFKAQYVVPEKAKRHVADLKAALKKADEVILASDEDREGEAIAWHLAELLGLRNPKRIVFHEITKQAITEALKNPRTINEHLVDAQQARRVLDRLVGYKLSPILWKKVRIGLSAGRVQSVALRIVVEREREISAFESSSSFRISGEFTSRKETFTAELTDKLGSDQEAREFLESLKGAEFKVADVTMKPAKRSPAPPFTTSTLQQEASRNLGMSVRATMQLAQRLYESGKITYMRTDSMNLSDAAVAQAGRVISSEFGAKYSRPRKYATKSAAAQEAHEAIRPTDFAAAKAGEQREQKLYELIRKRALASQMADAELERTIVTIASSANPRLFTAKGEVLLFDGFLKLYDTKAKEDKRIPKLAASDKLKANEITARESFTRPPARYTEATLVRQLEEMGIGRPSTYAPTVSVVQERDYVEKTDLEGRERQCRILTLKENEVREHTETETVGADRNKLVPTELGNVVSDFLVKNFPSVVNYKFTAKVEQELDKIATGKKKWNLMISSFYKDFRATVQKAEDVPREEASQTREIGTDPATSKSVLIRIGRYGPMIQLGRTEDQEEKPRFAPAPPRTKMEDVTLEQALQMLSLPRELGEGITAQTGRFGPYVKQGTVNASIPQDKLFTITLQEAQKLLAERKEAAAKRIIRDFGAIQVLNGKFGPYLTNGTKNARIPKSEDPESLTLERATELLEAAPQRRTKKRKTSS